MNFPSYPLLSFYGDDFTGSTDALEVLASHQLETLLFLRQPTAVEIALARNRYAAVGIAGISRAKGPEWMDGHLPSVYNVLKQLGAAVCHYKVCSTFDSSPAIGNIGHALTLGRIAFDMDIAAPIVVGVPQMRRYTFIGHLFAAAGASSDVVRIDRHPTMSVHPITPMNESDLCIHLSKQAALRIGLLDIFNQQDCSAKVLTQLLAENDALFFDVTDMASQIRVGECLWRLAEQQREQTKSLFCVGSSGIQYALVAHWATLWPDKVRKQMLTAKPIGKIIVISGSCSPVTAEQIKTACRAGFAAIRIDTIALINEQTRNFELDRLKRTANEALERRMSPLLYSACGPDDSAIKKLYTFIDEQSFNRSETLALLGDLQGKILRELLQENAVGRVVVAGGDTAGAVVQALSLSALRMQAALFPGAPLCQAYAELDAEPVVEIALKGGQMGKADYFLAARCGQP